MPGTEQPDHHSEDGHESAGTPPEPGDILSIANASAQSDLANGSESSSQQRNRKNEASTKRVIDAKKQAEDNAVFDRSISALLNSHQDNTLKTVESLRALIDRLHANYTEERERDRVNASRDDARIQELESQNSQLRQSLALSRHTASQSASEAKRFRRDLSTAQHAAKTANEAVADLTASRAISEARFREDSSIERVRRMQQLGARIHELVITRVARLAELEEQWDDKRPDQTLMRAISDESFLLVHAWRRIQREYDERTRGGTFEGI